MKENITDRRNERYNRYVEAVSPKSNTFISLIKAFLIGGTTCVIGMFIADIVTIISPSLDSQMVGNITSMILVSVAILITGFGFYDVIAKHGGAGSFLPITGFANAMASASMEFRAEGLILGTSVKLFSVVGPVVVNGIVYSTLCGLLRLLVEAII